MPLSIPSKLLPVLHIFSDAQLGQLVRALHAIKTGAPLPPLDPTVELALHFLRPKKSAKTTPSKHDESPKTVGARHAAPAHQKTPVSPIAPTASAPETTASAPATIAPPPPTPRCKRLSRRDRRILRREKQRAARASRAPA